jgi:hypothetical protein
MVFQERNRVVKSTGLYHGYFNYDRRKSAKELLSGPLSDIDLGAGRWPILPVADSEG